MSKKPNDAAKVAALAGILQSGNQQKDVPPSPAPPAAAKAPPAAKPAPAVAKSNARPLGKNSDPAWHLYGIRLRKDTHKRAKRRWEDMEPESDFSDLVEMLLEQWLKSNG